MVILPQPRNVLSEESMVYIIVWILFEETGAVTNIEGPVNHRFAHFAENIAIVSESVAQDPNVSIPRPSQELGLSYGTL